MIDVALNGFLRGIKSAETWFLALFVDLVSISRWREMSRIPSTNFWDAGFLTVADSAVISFGVGVLITRFFISNVDRLDHLDKLVRAGSYSAQVKRSSGELLGFFMATFGIVFMHLIAFAIGAQRGLGWSTYALSVPPEEPSAYSSIIFARNFSNPFLALALVALCVFLAYWLPALICYRLALQGMANLSKIAFIAWVVWAALCSLSPIPLPPFLDSSRLYSLGWALQTDGGINWSIAGFCTLLAIYLLLTYAPKKLHSVRNFPQSRAAIAFLQLGLLLLATRTFSDGATPVSTNMFRNYFSTVDGDIFQYLIIASIPLVTVSAYISRISSVSSSRMPYEALRFGSYLSWQVRVLLRELFWCIPLFIFAFVVPLMASGTKLHPFSASNLILPFAGFFALTVLEFAIATVLIWLPWPLESSWALAAGALVTFGYFNLGGKYFPSIFAPFALSDDGFDYSPPTLGIAISLFCACASFAALKYLTKPKHKGELL